MKGGKFRGFMAAAAALIGLGQDLPPPTRNMADPILRNPYQRKRKRAHGLSYRKKDPRPMMSRGHLGPPKCEPGTITYHDKLVRHFGRRQADKYGRIIRAGQLDLLPTAEDFANNPPWAFLASR